MVAVRGPDRKRKSPTRVLAASRWEAVPGGASGSPRRHCSEAAGGNEPSLKCEVCPVVSDLHLSLSPELLLGFIKNFFPSRSLFFPLMFVKEIRRFYIHIHILLIQNWHKHVSPVAANIYSTRNSRDSFFLQKVQNLSFNHQKEKKIQKEKPWKIF